METNKQIVLYGKSLILGSIKSSLRRCPKLQVTTLLPTPSMQEIQKLDSLKLDILLFDLETTQPETVFSLLKSDSNLQVIGISPGINRVKIWSIRDLREVSMQDLLQVIKSKEMDSLSESGCDENCSY